MAVPELFELFCRLASIYAIDQAGRGIDTGSIDRWAVASFFRATSDLHS